MKCGIKTKLTILITLAWITIGAVILYLLLKADLPMGDGTAKNRTLVD